MHTDWPDGEETSPLASEQILDAIDDLCYQTTPDGRLCQWNDHLAEATGHEHREIAGRFASDLFDTECSGRVADAIATVASEGERRVVEARLSTGDRQPYELAHSPVTDEAGAVCVVGIGRAQPERPEAVLEGADESDREHTLERQNDLFRRSQEIASVGAWETDLETGETRWTEEVYRILGVSTEFDADPEQAIELYHPDDRSRVRAAFERAVEDGEPYDIEVRLQSDDGDPRWVRTRGDPRVVDGEVVHVRGTMQDITERKRQQQEREQIQTRFLTLFEKAPVAISIHDMEGNIQTVNERHSEILGYSRAELESMNVAEFEAGLNLEELREVWTRIDIGGTRRVESRLERKDGSTFPAEVWANKVELAGDSRFLAFARDITNRTENERQLKLYREIVEALDDPIMLQDRDGAFRLVNGALTEFAGYSREELLGTDEFLFMDRETAATIDEQKRRTIETGEPTSYEVTPTFQSTNMDASFSTERYPHRDMDGNISGTLAICRDVTDLKERKTQLQVVDRVLRHNVRNKLTAISGFAELIRERASGPATEEADRILSEADDLATTAEKSRAITKVFEKPPAVREIALGALVERVRDTVAQAHPTAGVTTRVPESVTVSATDNLFNAIEELVENGIIHSDSDTPRVELHVTADEDTAAVCVVDNGPGIPDIERAVFEEGAEIDELYHGSGLGLWLVYWIVRRSGGTVSIAENTPEGTTVRVELPLESTDGQ